MTSYHFGPVEVPSAIHFARGLLSLRYDYRVYGYNRLPEKPLVITDLPTAPPTIDLFPPPAGTGNLEIDNTDPITAKIMAKHNVWGRKLWEQHADTDMFAEAKGLAFINLGKMFSKVQADQDGTKEFKFKIVNNIASDRTLPATTAYWVWFNFGDPFPGSPPFDFQRNIAFDSVWGTMREAQNRAAILNEHSAYHVETYTSAPGTVHVASFWSILAETWSKKKDFPLDNENEPLWKDSANSSYGIFKTDNLVHTVSITVTNRKLDDKGKVIPSSVLKIKGEIT